VGCGRYQNKHAQQHFQTKKHSVFINPKTGLVWCLECDFEITEAEALPIKAIFTVKKQASEEKPVGSKGIVGLRNLGNTCFMNASLQCLNNIHAFSRFFSKVVDLEEVKNSEKIDFSVMNALVNFFREMWKGQEQVLSPKEFWDAFSQACPFFKGAAQHDSQEFLRIFLDKLHEELKFEAEPGQFRSIISDTFQSKVQNKLTCTKCGNCTVAEEEYYDLSLSIPSSEEIESYKAYSSEVMNPQERISHYSEKHTLWNKIQQVFTENKNIVSIYDCLLSFCLPEELKQHFYCDRCGEKTPSRREAKLIKAPNTLMVVIKRFKFHKAGVKISTYVQFPMTIDLRYFLLRNTSCQYQLTGLIQHIGGMNGGHYIACCKNYKTNSWYEFDDSRTRKISEQQLLEREAYILFYQQQIPDQREKLRTGNKNTLLPSYWCNLYYTLAEPGKICQNYLFCSHKNVKPGFSLANFTSVAVNQDLEIRENFKSDGKQIFEVSECQRCLMTFSTRAIRAEMELELISELNSIVPFEGPWFIISVAWLAKWKAFCSLECSWPGAVDNTLLLEDGKGKSELEKGKHYRGVNRHVWAAFMALYGGGPEIRRLKVDLGDLPVPMVSCNMPDLTEEYVSRIKAIKATGVE
jgi:ubiquitin C-terminal hydrolase